MATTGILNGTDLLMYVGSDIIGHATSHTLSVTMSSRDSTTKSSGGWAAKLGGLRSWEASGEGFMAYDASYGYDELLAVLIARTAVTIKLSTEETGDTYWTGSALLESIEQSSGVEENVTFSFSFGGTGALAPTTVGS